jgi:hypothetical protein
MNPTPTTQKQGGVKGKPCRRHASLRIFLALCLCASVAMGGCAAANGTKASVPLNENITAGIAAAGAAAIKAEQEYEAGQIPQTATNRQIINALGTAYNDALETYRLYLNAASIYQNAQSVQLAACAPNAATTNLQIGGKPADCPGATSAATSAQAALGGAQTTFNLKAAAMAHATAAVTAISK